MPLKKQTVDYISSIEHLDKPLMVVGIKAWLFVLFSIILSVAILIWAFQGTVFITATGKGLIFDRAAILYATSPVSGVVSEIRFQAGRSVKKGQLLMTITTETDKKLPIYAPAEGVLTAMKVTLGEAISKNTKLFVMQGPSQSNTLKIYGFLPLTNTAAIKPGMYVNCALNSVNSSVNGSLRGVVKEVIAYPLSLNDPIMQEIPSESLRQYLLEGDEPTQMVIIAPVIDPHTFSGFAWTSKQGPSVLLTPGMIGTISVILDKRRPISYLIPRASKP